MLRVGFGLFLAFVAIIGATETHAQSWVQAPHLNGVYPAPFRYVGKIATLWPDGWREGTGFLVGPNKVMTAAHVVFRPGMGTPKACTFTPGAFGNTAPFGSANAVGYWVPKGFQEQWLGFRCFDVAVFQINQDLGYRTRGWFKLKDFPLNSSISNCSLISSDPSRASDPANTVRISSAGPVTADPYDDGYYDYLDSKRYRWECRGIPEGGRSGAPLVRNVNGSWEVYGVYNEGPLVPFFHSKPLKGVKITPQLRSALGF